VWLKVGGFVPGGLAPDFGRSVNPISTRGSRLCPPYNTGTAGFSDLPTALKISFIICRYATRIVLEIPPCAHHVIFITEFVFLIKTPPFYEVNPFNRKWLAHGGILKMFF
jgi:hypothetical protein